MTLYKISNSKTGQTLLTVTNEKALVYLIKLWKDVNVTAIETNLN